MSSSRHTNDYNVKWKKVKFIHFNLQTEKFIPQEIINLNRFQSIDYLCANITVLIKYFDEAYKSWSSLQVLIIEGIHIYLYSFIWNN